MSTEMNQILTDLQKSVHDFKKENDLRLKQIEEKGAAHPDLEVKVNKLNEQITELEGMKSKLTELETAMTRRVSKGSHTDADEKKAMEFAMLAKQRGNAIPDGFDADALAEYRKGFNEFLRKGSGPTMAKALSVGSDPDGGYLVDPDTNGRIITKLFDTSPMRQFASVQSIGTDALEGIHDNDEADAGWVSETGSRSETGTPQIQTWRIPVHEMYANPKATQKLLDDSMVDVESWLARKVADKFSRMENAAFVSGDGVNKPRGILTYAAGTGHKQIEQINTGLSGGFKADGSGADVIIDTIYAIQQGYRAGSNWFMPRDVVGAVRKIKDSQGRYLWAPGMDATSPSTLLGYGIAEFEDMPAAAAGSLSIAFGNMAEAYQIVDRAGIRVLRDPYSSKPYVQFYTVKRVGGDVVNFDALKLIKFAA